MVYPKVFLRVKGMLLDSLILGVLIYSPVFVVVELGIESPALKALFMLIPALLFEPLCVCFSGGSIGHHYAGLQVADAKSGKKLNFFMSLVRFLIKIPLGLVSLVSILITKRHQAIHDYLSHSVMIFKLGASAPEHHKLIERSVEEMADGPSVFRRLVVILAFCSLWLIVIGFVLTLAASKKCIENPDFCSQTENSMANSITLLALGVIFILVILGLMSKLPGAYHKKTSKS